MSTEDYYKPYCPRCKTYVQPQVVAATSVYGGGHVSGGIGSTSVSSTVTYKKMCPTCGEEVFSQSDIDEFTAKRAADKEKAKKEKTNSRLDPGHFDPVYANFRNHCLDHGSEKPAPRNPRKDWTGHRRWIDAAVGSALGLLPEPLVK